MGTTTTQKRFLAKDITYASQLQGYDLNVSSFETTPRTRTSQETTSYRSSPSDDPLSPEARAAFVDVTRNGLTESNPRYDTGHPFFTTKTWNRFSHPDWKMFRWATPTLKETWRGPLIPRAYTNYTSGSDWYYPPIPRLSSNEIALNGTKMIKASIPTKSSADLAVFLGEAMQALPAFVGASLFQERTREFSSIGGEYLNVQFGWLPFVNDVRKAAEAVANASAIIRQFKRDSGRVVRRRMSFEPKITSSQTTYTPQGGSYTNLLGLVNAWDADYATNVKSMYKPTLIEDISQETYSFSGAFSYYLNMDDSMMGRIERIEAEANRLLGTSLTPSTLWELAPWSWLTDWVWNVGDIISNATALSSDGLVMRYGYLMRHTVAFKRLTIPDGDVFQGNLKTGPITALFGRETKERVKGTPYGFGINASGFSAKQWAILGALGLTKGSNILP